MRARSMRSSAQCFGMCASTSTKPITASRSTGSRIVTPAALHVAAADPRHRDIGPRRANRLGDLPRVQIAGGFADDEQDLTHESSGRPATVRAGVPRR